VQALQAETQDIVRFADKTLPEKGSIGDQS
jgi:hypothetical protein